jgi:hypothetical protein
MRYWVFDKIIWSIKMVVFGIVNKIIMYNNNNK